MTPRRDIPKADHSVFFILAMIAIVSVVAYAANSKGYRKGYAEGAKVTKAAMEEAHEEDIAYYKGQLESSFRDGHAYGQQSAERDCKNQLSIAEAIRKMDIEKYYKQGAMDGIRHVAIKCGKPKK